MEEEPSTNNNKRDREISSSDLTTISPSVKRLRSDLLLDILDDETDAATEDGLASVIKSLEEEITLQSQSPLNKPSSDALLQPDLDYLLEASDDELGLPPTVNSYEKDFGGGFDDGFYECCGCDEFGVWNGEFFGYGDEVFQTGDFGEVSWRQETLPAV